MSVQRYRKKPVVVEAIRYLPGLNCDDVAEFTGAPHDAHDCHDDAEWIIETLEGTMYAKPGDWIIKGVAGEFYPCKPEIFNATYELAEAAESECEDADVSVLQAEATEIEIAFLRAVEQACNEHDAWLSSIGMPGVTDVNPDQHPFLGLGAPASDIAEVILHGETSQTWWTKKILAYGITSFMQIPFEEGRRLVDYWLTLQPVATASERAVTVHALRRAAAKGWVARNPDLRAWALTVEGDAVLAAEVEEGDPQP